MNIKDLITRCIALFSSRDKKILVVVSFLQAAMHLLDIVAIALIGVIGALSVTYVSGLALPNWVESLLQFIRLDNLSIEKILIFISVVTASLFTLKSISSVFINFKILKFLSRRQAAISARLSKQLSSAPYQFIKKKESQNIIFSVTDGVNYIILGVLANFLIGISELVLLVLIMFFLFIFNPVTAIFTLVFFGLVALFLHYILGRISYKYGQKSSLTSILGRNQISNLIYAFKELVVFRRSDYFSKKFNETRTESANASAIGVWLQQLPKYIYEMALIFGAAVIVGFQILQNSAGGGISTLMVFLASATRLTPALMRVQTCLLLIKSYQPGAIISLDLMDELRLFNPESEVGGLVHPLTSPPRIELINVDFKFQDGLINVLSDISLTIPAGKVTAFTGLSGSGKTTLIDLILGIYPPTAGKIMFHQGEYQIPANLVTGAAYVPQDPFIIDGTLKENIAFGIPEELVIESNLIFAIQSSGLKSVVSSLPEGVLTNIGNLSSRLSGGEKQRIAIARALYIKPKLLVIDEGTSALDGLTEKFITDTLFALAGSTTVVLIAHRFSSIKNADTIHYMNNGFVLNTGTWDELKQSTPEFRTQVELMGLD
jgi:ATP-binding cassette subfamily C protein